MRRLFLAVALVALAGAGAAQAQTFPSKQVRFIVPAAPGGSFDALARILAQSLNDRWPQRVIVDNRPGGAGNIAAREVARAEPDGYTLLTWNDTLLINPYLFKEAPFDPKRDVFAERVGCTPFCQPEELFRFSQSGSRRPWQVQLWLARQRQPRPSLL
jgi:tripartite-type tricarboxylate transporter receptor subunit TctC